MLETARGLCQKAVSVIEVSDLGFIGSTEQTTAHWLLKCESVAVFPDHKLWLLGSALQQ